MIRLAVPGTSTGQTSWPVLIDVGEDIVSAHLLREGSKVVGRKIDDLFLADLCDRNKDKPRSIFAHASMSLANISLLLTFSGKFMVTIAQSHGRSRRGQRRAQTPTLPPGAERGMVQGT